MTTEHVQIFDTTLRDGEQSPGASMNVEEKVMVAKQLARLGVDIIEAGFAYSSPGDFDAVRRIAQEVEGPTICSLARARPEDIDRAWEALKGAPRVRIHTFLSTSDIHLKHQFRMTREEAKKRAVEMVQRARSYVDDVEFSPMDASRSDPAYLYEVIEAVISAGAGTVNIPDTVGYAIPQEFGKLIRGIREQVPNSAKAVISVHCHNDLGLAVANSLAAVMEGAGQVEFRGQDVDPLPGDGGVEHIGTILVHRIVAARAGNVQDPQDCQAIWLHDRGGSAIQVDVQGLGRIRRPGQDTAADDDAGLPLPGLIFFNPVPDDVPGPQRIIKPGGQLELARFRICRVLIVREVHADGHHYCHAGHQGSGGVDGHCRWQDF